jgi:hypothetical protein
MEFDIIEEYTEVLEQNENGRKKTRKEDPRTSGLWAQHASTAHGSRKMAETEALTNAKDVVESETASCSDTCVTHDGGTGDVRIKVEDAVDIKHEIPEAISFAPVKNEDVKHVDLVNSELSSCNETCVMSTLDGNKVIGIEAERVSDVSEVADQETTIPAIKEPNNGMEFVEGETGSYSETGVNM